MSRFAIIGLMLMAPLVGPGFLYIVLAIAASLTAYEGPRRNAVYSMFVALLFIELLYGLDVGVLSLSYLVAISLLLLMRRVVVVVPWSASDGWHAFDALRSLGVACGLLAVMVLSGVVVGHFLYGYTDMRIHLQSLFVSQGVAYMPIVMAAMLVILRRIDEPFRRRILFGT